MNGNTRFRAYGRLASTVALLLIWFGINVPQSYGAGVWTNEPAGATVIADWGWPTLTGSGWHDEGGDTSVVSDPSAPFSPASVLQHRYSIGFPGGISPGNDWFLFPQTSTEVYVGFWWKANAGWQGNPSNINKILYISDTGGNPFALEMVGTPGGPYNLTFIYQNSDIDNSHIAGYPSGTVGSILLQSGVIIPPGNWHKIECYIKRSTTNTSRDGIFRWWANGVIAGNITNANTARIDMNAINIAPVWGGAGGNKTQVDYFWFDHIHVSVGNGAPSSDQPPGPPASPTIRGVSTP